MQPSVSIIIPAWNEAFKISETLRSLHDLRDKEGIQKWNEFIVVDDGSEDHTYEMATPWADQIIKNPRNLGKGASLEAGWKRAKNDIVVFLDADLGGTAFLTYKLVEPILNGNKDMVIARFPKAQKKGGFGLVKKLAVQGIYMLCGYETTAPLSGQRALRKQLLQSVPSLSDGFGIEVGLTIDAVNKGFKICEVDVPYQHRETGRDWAGFTHRGKQFVSVSKTLYHKWRDPVC
ncbi:glycosyltransferase family 2 protein [Chengkuizengella axinellae]|uniref:Glucosyl-3-phosphoglycerate synthase n=1 Tax=Chengkuizengella axinellae TaxID=3064388 RepID=A0ABT9IWA8_9BACL|nr:glycosyltransferase family 2 protein [Chengkuizengella sp. 2205SS18-9]MDP5273620.1 glycosyltransferase family 2 protein [Chengkuizengella sp. 2205SS18-9]